MMRWMMYGSRMGANAIITYQCTVCERSFPVVEAPLAEAMKQVAEALAKHEAEEHSVCGAHGYRANSYPCRYTRGHQGPCQWDS